MTTQEVKNIINGSFFPDSYKKRLIFVLPNLGNNTLTELAKEISRGDSLIISDFLVSLWEEFSSLLVKIKNSDKEAAENLNKFIGNYFSVFNGEEEFYILSFVLDSRLFLESAKFKDSEVFYKKFIDYEIKLFWFLPKDEVVYLFHYHLLSLLKKIKMPEDLQVAVYKHDWDFYENFNKAFIEALMDNKELLGKTNKKTVGGWISNYLDFTLPLHTQATTFGVAEYMLKSADIKKLNQEDQDSVGKIIKLFVWLSYPEVDQREIRNYIGNVSRTLVVGTDTDGQKFELPEDVLRPGKSTSGAARLSSPAVPSSISDTRKAGGEKLERKNSVEELIKKNLAKPAAVNFPAVSAVRTEKKYQKPVVVPRTETEKKQPGSDIDLGQVDMSKVIDARILKLKSKSNKNDEQKSN